MCDIQPMAEADLSQPRVLIVEDSPTQSEQLRLILESAGFKVAAAASGEAGLDTFRTSSFDLVLTDILMPDISGFELCKRIHAERGAGNVPVVLLTTLREPSDIINGLESGAVSFLVKPVEPDALVQTIRQVLIGHQLAATSSVQLGFDIQFLGRKITISKEREQILGLLAASIEDTIRVNRQLQESQAQLAAASTQIAEYNRRLERQLQHSDALNFSLMLAATDAIGVLDEDGRIVDVNCSAERLMGLPREELIGRHCTEFVDASAGELVMESCRLALAQQPGQQFGLKITRPDGQVRWVDVSTSPVDSCSKRAVLSIARDVTEHRQLEEQLRQSQKMEAVGSLAGGVAHDFNNLLTVITGYTNFILEGLEPANPLRHDAEAIHKAADRASALTHQLLAFSRKQVLQPKVVDLAATVADMEKMLRRLIGEHIELRTRAAGDLWRVRADPGQMGQVLLNLAVNARDAMPGGGTLLVELENVELDEAFTRANPESLAGPHVLMAVTDTGHGMDETTRDRIFEPFFTTKEKGKGTGLGLSTVYGIVKQSQGTIVVDSAPGRGTAFRVYLPRVDETGDEAAPVAAARPATGSHETILLVEDEDAVRALARRALERCGYKVLEAQHGEDALLAAERHDGAIDLLVTDLVMPQMSGPSLSQRLCLLRPGLNVLYMSGYSDDEALRRHVSGTTAQFLEKPFAPSVLAQAVRRALDSVRGQAK